MRPSLKLTFFLITHSDIIAKIIQKSVNYLHMSQLLEKKSLPTKWLLMLFFSYSFLSLLGFGNQNWLDDKYFLLNA